MKKLIPFFLIIITTISYLMPVTCYADSQNPDVIRVCYFPLENNTTKHEEHPYHGYYYDYLQEISQYTDWTYEYVDASYSECLEMLQNQEIDLICGIDKTEERVEQMDFSTVPLISSRYKIFVSEDNDEIYYNDYEHFNNISLGVLVSCSQQAALDTLCEEQNISFEKKYYTSETALENALEQGEVDAIYAITVSDNSAFRIAAHFPSTQLYFAAAKGDAILNEIMDVQNQIRTTSPYLEYDLFEKNIGLGQDFSPFFTREEANYIKEHPDVYFSSDPNWAPIESYNQSTGKFEGITAEILDLLEEYTGLHFIYKPSATFTDALNHLKYGETDILTAFSHDYTWAEQNNVNLSSAYLDSYIVMIHNPNTETGTNCVALPSDFNITRRIVDSKMHENIIYFDTIEECIEAVADGKADFTYTNYYIAKYYLSNIAYRSLTATKISSSNENLCIAVSEDTDPLLLSIINKGLCCISSAEVDAITLKYTLYENEFSLRTLIYAYPETVLLWVTIISMLAVIILVIDLLIHQRRTHMIESISQTDALTGILNRGAVQTLITMTLEKEKQSPELVCPLISLDLDNFKGVNDTYGHAEGDLLLKAVANTLKLSVRQTDIVGRMGGDEFIVYLTNVNNKQTAEKVAAKLCTAVSALSLKKGEWINISASFGIAYGDSNSTWSTLYHQADVALYDAKAKGKNQYSVYTKENPNHEP